MKNENCKLKILFLAASNSIHSVRWIKYFYEKGHEIIWVSLAPPIDEAKELISSAKIQTSSNNPNIKYYEIKPSPLSDINGSFAIRYLPSAVYQLKKIIQKEKPDLMHIHSAGTYGLVGALSGFKPIFLTPWGSDILLVSNFKKFFVKLSIRKADLFTCDGENTRQALINFGVKPEKIKMIRFGTDIEKFKPNYQLPTTNSKPKIISLRNLEPVYDIETLIKAAEIVLKEFSDIEFQIIGDGSEREYLENLAKKLGVEKNVKFLGKVQNQFIPEYLQSADIYVSTSLSDSGLAASTAEAMACGLPVVVSDSGDNKEWVKDFENGFVVPLRNPEILAEKILYLVKNEDERKKMSENNRKLIEEKNNYYKEMEKMEEIYRGLTKK
jgi:glycosyltransferase involved in cell wall biosynthesis